MKLNEKTIFLLDGVGAALSAIIVGVVLPLFPSWIGLSAGSLHLLGLVASLFAVYSLTCFWFARHTKAPMLLAIMLANSFYCAVVLAMAFISSELTTFGRAYFILEAVIIIGIVFLESRIYRRSFGPVYDAP